MEDKLKIIKEYLEDSIEMQNVSLNLHQTDKAFFVQGEPNESVLVQIRGTISGLEMVQRKLKRVMGEN